MTSAAGPLARLLEQATPGPWNAYPNSMRPHLSNVYATDEVYGSSGLLAPVVKPADARLIALAPDGLRLLADMAAWVDYAYERLDPRYATDDSVDEGRSLLARFAELQARAAQ